MTKQLMVTSDLIEARESLIQAVEFIVGHNDAGRNVTRAVVDTFRPLINLICSEEQAMSTYGLQINEFVDNAAVDRFAEEMKARLSRKRGQGRGGWFSPHECSKKHLKDLLSSAVREDNMVDVANFAMMALYHPEATND